MRPAINEAKRWKQNKEQQKIARLKNSILFSENEYFKIHRKKYHWPEPVKLMRRQPTKKNSEQIFKNMQRANTIQIHLIVTKED